MTSRAVRTAARVASEMPGLPLRTRLTVASLTPACFATSARFRATLQNYTTNTASPAGPRRPLADPGLTLFSTSPGREVREIRRLHTLAGDAHDLRRALRPHRGGANAFLEHRALADDGSGAELCDDVAVDFDLEQPVEDEKQLVALLALLDQRFAFCEPFGLRAVLHELARQLALEIGLDGADEGRRVRGAPRSVLLVRLAVPLLEVDHAALLDEVAVVVVDPVARERARA